MLQTHTICASNESSNNTELKFDMKNFSLLKDLEKQEKKIFLDGEFLKKEF